MKQRGNAALSAQEVARIKRELLEGIQRKYLARRYEVGLETIARIARGETWTDIPPASGAHLDKLEAEILAPANLQGMIERATALPVGIACPHCRNGVPKLENGKHWIERLDMELSCG
jgi:hypothetical protein